MTLFVSGDFTSHAGLQLSFKIECDALTDADLTALAALVAPKLPPFGHVVGIPRGGVRFAKALTPYITSGANVWLIVDDVVTSGKSFLDFRRDHVSDRMIEVHGLAIFGRGPFPDWVRIIFKLEEWAR